MKIDKQFVDAMNHASDDTLRIAELRTTIATLRASLQAAEMRAAEAYALADRYAEHIAKESNAVGISDTMTPEARVSSMRTRVAALEKGLREAIPYIERHAQCSNPDLLATLRTLLRGDGEKPKCGTCGTCGGMRTLPDPDVYTGRSPCPDCAADEKKTEG